jgi:hypothetical protein
MTQENKSQKKVDYKILSNVNCTICGRPLKQNTAAKGHTKCYVCFKLSQGKRYYYKKGVKIDRLAIQKANILEYKGGVV